ncbi:hypothetical protein G6O69_38120 [Pseudenhygromyxa sp. WMMC2535]|uniref:hypothetical protein n=1 Tax=Pseudenhygromyxa sp. WMMC2535 TaxID=2712867 RepID=UPI001595143C|nr:hypothetical protein [Pseudenhygromyxa sp. WMMC2535]NVB41376.1 hypothetical protein [Pseudenhygromyxa sp. WMMC2535]NVB43685.1 hypothetical protein [Pseudenhygromyxa sp. WMMC2535]
MVFALACIPGDGGDDGAGGGSETTEESGATDTTTESTDTSTESTDTTTETGTTESTDTTTETGEGETGEGETGEGETGEGETESGETESGETESGETETESGESTDSSTDTDTESDTTDTETDTGGSSCLLAPDIHEDNDTLETAAVPSWNANQTWSIRAHFDATLCGGDDDWYYFDLDVNQLEGDGESFLFKFDVIVDGSSWCGAGCGESTLPAAPENTIGVNIYSAADMTLLHEKVSSKGRLDLEGVGPIYGQDIVVQIYGLAEADFEYQLNFEVRFDLIEDECEC